MESNHVRDLMEAYSSIYTENEEVEQLDEFSAQAQNFVNDATKRIQSGLEKIGVPINRTQRGTPTKKDQKEKINQNQSFDLFDIIKGHLLDEGFADTEEAALAIMTNMSEDWKESIVEGMFGSLPKSTTVIPGKYGKNTVLSKKGGVEGVSDKSKPGSFTPQKGGFDKMDAERYAMQHSKQGTSSGTSGINLAGRRETSGRVK